jgi:hypothetical protein
MFGARSGGGFANGKIARYPSSWFLGLPAWRRCFPAFGAWNHIRLTAAHKLPCSPSWSVAEASSHWVICRSSRERPKRASELLLRNVDSSVSVSRAQHVRSGLYTRWRTPLNERPMATQSRTVILEVRPQRAFLTTCGLHIPQTSPVSYLDRS